MSSVPVVEKISAEEIWSLVLWVCLGVTSISSSFIYVIFGTGNIEDRTTLIGFLAICIAGIFIYSIPALIARLSGHPSRTAIYFVSIFFGWTLIGWITAMIWALAGINARAEILRRIRPEPEDPGTKAALTKIERPAFRLLLGTSCFLITGAYFVCILAPSGKTPAAHLAPIIDGKQNVAQETKTDHRLDAVKTVDDYVAGIAHGMNSSPSAIVCDDLDTVQMVLHLYSVAWEEQMQDKLTRGQSRLIRGEAAENPDPEAYGCTLIPAGTPLKVRNWRYAPVIKATLPDGTEVTGVTMQGMAIPIDPNTR